MAVTQKEFGKTRDGRGVVQTEITNAGGASVQILNYGGVLQSVRVPDKNGNMTQVCLGYETLEEYEAGMFYFGALIGRYANRIGGGRFSLNGVPYQLEKNDGPNHLHGGSDGFHTRVYETETGENSVTLRRVSKDGESGYPGNLQVAVRYTWLGDNTLEIGYSAETDADTIVNLTNHAYFNLSGAGQGDIGDTLLQIPAGSYTEIDENGLPTGVIAPVAGTPFDFRKEKPVGQDIDADDPQIRNGKGFDHNFVLESAGGGEHLAAAARSPKSGIRLQVFTTKPGMQFYSGNFMTPAAGIGGRYDKRGGFCLETQYFPDGLAHAGFPSPILKKGEHYRHKTVFRFDLG